MPDITASVLKQSVLDHVEQLGASAQAFPWENKTAYGCWLAQTYYFVRHTTSFLSLTASRFGPWQRERQYFQLSHLREESGHDELLLSDLNALGFKIETFEELPETAALYQSQYYFIDHENPASHWAYAYLLEGVAAKKIRIFIDRVESSHATGSSQFLRVHKDEDQGHFERGLGMLDHLTAAEADSYQRNLIQCAYFYAGMLEHIQRVAL
jgi:pyrroloquinoline quinone (PQQ) biosynthesis protein C